MSDMIKLNINEASAAQLRYYAGTKLGIDGIKMGQQTAFLIGKILAVEPDATEIEVPAEGEQENRNSLSGQPQQPLDDTGDVQVQAKKMDAKNPLHFSNDPKITINVHPTSDPTKAKRVFVTVQGDVFEIKRGADVDVPYRVYLALSNGVERIGRDSGEVHPQSGMPIMEFADQVSYPFQVKPEGQMPSKAEIAAWNKLHSSPPKDIAA